MAGLKDLSSIWKNIKEIDLKPIRDSATHPVLITLVGRPGVGKHTLAEQMRSDPSRPGVKTQTSLTILPLEAAAEVPAAHLHMVMLDASQKDFTDEQLLVKKWSEAGRNVLVFVNIFDSGQDSLVSDILPAWQVNSVLMGSARDVEFLQREFIPAVLELLPQQHLALGRQFPLFRVPIARQLITDTCFSNAAYALSTGLAENITVLDIPLNVTDMIVLTKSQAFLVYKLGLLVGFTTRWQDYLTEFGSVIGGGFLWRQLARGLVGLIPVWGVIPKVAVAYSGTYVVGNAILGWYLTGRNLSPQQMRQLSAQAFDRGKDYARRLISKLPRPKPGKRKQARLPAGTSQPVLPSVEEAPGLDASLPNEPGMVASVPASPAEIQEQIEPAAYDKLARRSSAAKPPHPRRAFASWRRKKTQAQPILSQVCPACGKTSAADASFCQYCGHSLGG